MNAIRQKIHGYGGLLYRKESGRCILAGIVTLLILAITYKLFFPVFMTIDDARMMYVYAGYATGTPEANYLFSYYPLSWLLSRLYTALPSIPWYAIYHFFCIGLGSTLIGKTVYKLCRKKSLSLPIAILIHIIAYATLCLVSTIMVHFEITSTMIGTAGVALLIGIDSSDSRRKQLLEAVLAAVCLCICCIIAYNSFYAICGYILVAVLYLLLRAVADKRLKPMLKLIGAFLLCLCVLVVGVRLIEGQAKNTEEWAEYYKYNKYRVSFWDYPHMTYEGDPELFAQIGWSSRLYKLADRMYFMDERFNAEALSAFIQPHSWLRMPKAAQMAYNFTECLYDLFERNSIPAFQLLFLSVLSILLISRLFDRRLFQQPHWPEAIAALCCFLGTIVLVCFLALRGRLPMRAWLACSIPCGIAMVLLGLRSLKPSRPAGKRKWLCVVLCICLAFEWGYQCFSTYDNVKATDWMNRYNRLNYITTIEEYAMAHPENIYVFDNFGARNYNIFTNYPDENHRPVNAVIWGSSYVYTPTYYKQLSVLGRSSLRTEDFLSDDVYYISSPHWANFSLLKKLLGERYPNVTSETIEVLDNEFEVYKFHIS